MKERDLNVVKPLPEEFRINPDISDYSNDPVVIKKKKRAEALIEKYGVPEG